MKNKTPYKQTMRQQVKNTFLQFLNNEITLQEFEQWIYISDSLEKILKHHDYLTLISINYDEKFALLNVTAILEKYINTDEYEKYRLCHLLNHIISNSNVRAQSIEETYHLYCHGYNFFEKLGLNYGLDLVVHEYASQTIDDMYPKIIDDAKDVLNLLKSDKIVFSDSQEDTAYELRDYSLRE